MTNWLLLGSGPSLAMLPRHLPDHAGWKVACVNASIHALLKHGRWPDAYGVFEYKCGKIFQQVAHDYRAARPDGRLILSKLALHGGALKKLNPEMLEQSFLPAHMYADITGYRTSGGLMLAVLAAELNHTGGGVIRTLGLDGYTAGHANYAPDAGGPAYDSIQADALNAGGRAYIAGVVARYQSVKIESLENNGWGLARCSA